MMTMIDEEEERCVCLLQHLAEGICIKWAKLMQKVT